MHLSLPAVHKIGECVDHMRPPERQVPLVNVDCARGSVERFSPRPTCPKPYPEDAQTSQDENQAQPPNVRSLDRQPAPHYGHNDA